MNGYEAYITAAGQQGKGWHLYCVPPGDPGREPGCVGPGQDRQATEYEPPQRRGACLFAEQGFKISRNSANINTGNCDGFYLFTMETQRV